jgi:hypothetical protein
MSDNTEPQITEADAERMIQMRRAGLTLDEIAQAYGVSRTRVFEILEQRLPADQLAATRIADLPEQVRTVPGDTEPPSSQARAPKRRRGLIIAAAIVVIAGVGIGLGVSLSGSGSVTASGTVLGVPSAAAYTATSALDEAPVGLCDVTPGTKVIITDSQGREVGWALLKVSKALGLYSDELSFTVAVPGGSAQYGVQIAGIGNTLSESPSQLGHMQITCSG